MVSLRIPELVGEVDLTDYPGMGLDLRRTGDFEGSNFVLLNIFRIDKRLFPMGYLRPFPEYSLLIEIDEGYVIGFDFPGEEFYGEFVRSYVSKDAFLNASYVAVLMGLNVLWFRRFPRQFVSHVRPEFISEFVPYGSSVDYTRARISYRGGILSYADRKVYGCYNVLDADEAYDICLDSYRVYSGGKVVRR